MRTELEIRQKLSSLHGKRGQLRYQLAQCTDRPSQAIYQAYIDRYSLEIKALWWMLGEDEPEPYVIKEDA